MIPEQVAETTAYALAEHPATRNLGAEDRRTLLRDILRPSIGNAAAEELAPVYADSWEMFAAVLDRDEAINRA